MRIGEMLALKWSAVRLRDDDPRIIVKCAIGRGSPEVGAYEKSTKNRQERYLPISRELANTLRQAKRQGDYVCGDPQTGERINYSTAYRAMQRINERANVGKKIKWHMFRHTAASMMCQHGSIAEAQMLLGHQSAKALDPYRHFTATLGQTTMATLGKLFSTPDHPSTPNNGPTISRRVIPLKKAQPV
jgi:integrase